MIVRKKPKIVEAIQWTGNNYDFICEFAEQKLKKDPARKLLVPTLEGTMKCSIGDFLIKGIEKELYPIKEPIFYDTYDILDD